MGEQVNTSVSKAEFARRKSRSKACVTKWIKLGKISPAALRDDGKIWLERAEADLLASLDPSQQVIQASPILAGAAAPALSGLPLVQSGDVPPAPPRPTAKGEPSEREIDLARRAKADADRAEYDAEEARRKLAIAQGKYVVAEDAAREWGRELARFVSDVETFLSSTLARELAAAHGLDWKVLSVEIREKFRAFRAETSEEARARREAPAPEAGAAADTGAQG